MLKNYLEFATLPLRQCYSTSKIKTFTVLLAFATSASLGALAPIFLGQGITYSLSHQELPTLIWVAVIYCLIWLSSSAIKYLAYPIYGHLEQRTQSDIAATSLLKSNSSPAPWRRTQDNSEVSFAIDAKMGVFRDVFSVVTMSILPAIVAVTTNTLSMYFLGGLPILIIYLLGMVAFILISIPLVNKHQKAQGDFFTSSLDNFGVLSNAVSYWKETKIFSLHNTSAETYRKSRIGVEEKGIYSYKVTMQLYLLQAVFLATLLAALLLSYLWLHQDQPMEVLVGAFASLVGICLYSMQVTQDIGFGVSQIATSYSQHESALEKIETTQEITSTSVKNLADFSPLAQKRTGIIWLKGESGAGKTTALESLLGFNRFALENPIATEKFHEVRYLPQETNLTFETPPQLVKAGRDNISSEDIARVLSSLGLSEFAEGGQRAEEVLLEHGVNLSGGQARRLAVARTLVGPSQSLLIFDEPTTGVDAENSMKIWNLIKEASKENLVLVVTHDVQTLASPEDSIVTIRPTEMYSD